MMNHNDDGSEIHFRPYEINNNSSPLHEEEDLDVISPKLSFTLLDFVSSNLCNSDSDCSDSEDEDLSNSTTSSSSSTTHSTLSRPPTSTPPLSPSKITTTTTITSTSSSSTTTIPPSHIPRDLRNSVPAPAVPLPTLRRSTPISIHSNQQPSAAFAEDDNPLLSSSSSPPHNSLSFSDDPLFPMTSPNISLQSSNDDLLEVDVDSYEVDCAVPSHVTSYPRKKISFHPHHENHPPCTLPSFTTPSTSTTPSTPSIPSTPSTSIPPPSTVLPASTHPAPLLLSSTPPSAGDLHKLPITSPFSIRDIPQQILSMAVPLEHLQVLEPIDSGAFSQVWKVRYNGQIFALKVLNHKHPHPERLFVREIRNLMYANRHISDEDVIRLRFVTADKLGMGFPFVEGGSLRLFLLRHDLTLHQRLLIARNIAAALANLHWLGLIHRDVTSENILMARGEEGQYSPILADLGLARLRESSLQPHERMTPQTGNMHWRAPEVSDGSRYSFPADVFSLGLVFWELFTGKRPFGDAARAREVAAQISSGGRPPLKLVASKAMRKLVGRMWEHEAGRRPGMIQVKEEIDGMLGGQRGGAQGGGGEREAERNIWRRYAQMTEQSPRRTARRAARMKKSMPISYSFGQTEQRPVKRTDSGEKMPTPKSDRELKKAQLTSSRSSERDSKQRKNERLTPVDRKSYM